MKKIYYLIAMAFMALTFTSCEDVPAPFGQPIDPNVQVVVDPEGDGSKAKPFNVSAAVAECKKIGATASTAKYYIKGKAKTDYTVDDYGNITVVITDVENSTTEFTVYRCKRADGTNFDKGYKVNTGDEIIVYGPIMNYKETTPETATGAYVVSINGEATGVEPASGGDSGSGGDTGGGSAVDMTKSTEGLVVTFTNANVTGSDKVTVDFSTLGLTSGSEIPEQTLANGTKISFAKNENTNAPKYYNDGVRMYAKNSMTIAGSKKIAKVVLNCITYTSSGNTINATGNEQMYGKADGNNVIINNDFTQASSGTQLRFKTMEITFEGEGSGDTGGGDAGGGGDTPSTSFSAGKYFITYKSGDTYYVAKPLDEASVTKGYGYSYCVETTATDGKLNNVDASNLFTFTAITGGFSIQDANNVYYYTNAKNKSFQVSATAPADFYWTVTLGTGGIAKINSSAKTEFNIVHTLYNNTTHEFIPSDTGDDIILAKEDGTLLK